MARKIICLLFVLCFTGVVCAQWIETTRTAPQQAQYPLEIVEMSIKLDIKGQFARVDIYQTFYNHGSGNVEGTYFFPIPMDVVVSEFVMWIDDKKYEPRILDEKEATRIYESYLRRNRDPALLRYAHSK